MKWNVQIDGDDDDDDGASMVSLYSRPMFTLTGVLVCSASVCVCECVRVRVRSSNY